MRLMSSHCVGCNVSTLVARKVFCKCAVDKTLFENTNYRQQRELTNIKIAVLQ